MNHEIISIMKVLLMNANVSVEDLAKQFHLSSRQALYRIHKINESLREKGDGSIQVYAKGTIVITKQIRNEMKGLVKRYDSSKYYYLSKWERMLYMYLMLFIDLEYVQVQHFIDDMSISRSTVLSDMKELNFVLKDAQIKIKNNRERGYYLDGLEINIRKKLMEFIIQTIFDQPEVLTLDIFIKKNRLDPVESCKQRVTNLANANNVEFIEARLDEFVFIFIFIKARIQAKPTTRLAHSSFNFLDFIKETKEFNFINDLLTSYGIRKQTDMLDMQYLVIWILGMSVGVYKDKTKDRQIISEFTNQVLVRFEALGGIHYKNYDDIFIQLYTHLRPAYYRILFNIPVVNPLSDKVKTEFKGVYRLVLEALKPFQTLFGKEISEAEIAYITIHFASIFANQKATEVIHKKNALILCTNGIGSSAILYNELTNLFPEINFLLPIERKALSQVQTRIDLIFTTVYASELDDFDIPKIKVNAILNSHEKTSLVRYVHMLIGNSNYDALSVAHIMQILERNITIPTDKQFKIKHELTAYLASNEHTPIKKGRNPMLSEITNENLIQQDIEATDWEDAIRKCARPLVEQHKVSEHYVQAMIDTAKEAGPYIVITKHVAMPHARPEMGAKDLAVGISVLRHPIAFGNKDNDPVKYVFCLSAIDNESHLKAMAELVELLDTQAFFETLDSATSRAEIYEYIKQHEQ